MIFTPNFKIIEDFLLVTDKLLEFTCPTNGGPTTDDVDGVMRVVAPNLYKWYGDE
jgi:hypothetical protein